MADEEIIYYPNPEIVTPETRIRELEQEIDMLRSGRVNRQGLMELAQNPSALGEQLNLSPQQAQNVKALIAAAGSGAGVKWLGKAFGDELAAAMGGAAAAFLAKKVFGR